MEEEIQQEGDSYVLVSNEDCDLKTTLLTNMPIIEHEEIPDHILPHELTVYSNSDGNLTINTIEQIIENNEGYVQQY